MSRITIRTARQNRPFTGPLRLRLRNGAGAYVLPQVPGSYELRLFRHGNTAPFATATIANGKLVIAQTADETIVTYSYPASDMQGLLGYGSMELISTVAGSTPVAVVPIQFVIESTPYAIDDGESFAIWQEDIVCVIDNRVVETLPGPFTIIVNTLPSGSPGSGSQSGSVLTLNVPRGADGSLTPTEAGKGLLALESLPVTLRGRKFAVIDFIGGGYCHFDDATGHELRSIENIIGSSISTPASGTSFSRKRRLITNAANALRITHGPEGSPQGVLVEPAQSYLHPRSQPTVAQCSSVLGAPTDTAGPANWSGNWIAFGDNTVRRLAAQLVTTVSGLDYWLQFYVRMTDLSAPAITDFDAYIAGGATAKHPDTGANGFKVEGPFASDVYRVTAYATSGFTGTTSSGIDKPVTKSAKTFIVGPISYGQGRYPPSHFANTTGTPNTRAADNISLPLSGFTSDEITLLADFVQPAFVGSGPCAAIIRNSTSGLNDSLGLWAGGNGTQLGCWTYSGGASASRNHTAGITPGTRYRAGFAQSLSAKLFHGKVSGIAALAPTGLTFGTPLAPNLIEVGSFNGGSHLGSTVERLIVLDRYLSPAEIAAYTG